MPWGNQAKKYWIIPQECFAPESLVLGQILKEANDPLHALNRRAVVQIDPLDILHEREQVSKSIGSALETGFGANLGASSVLAAIIGASPSVDGKWSSSASDSIEAAGVRVSHFDPSEEYVNKALRTDTISRFVQKNFFSAPIYMVVGVAIARTLSRSANSSSDKGGGANVGVGPPGLGVEISAGLSANVGNKSNYSDSVEDDVVLAYRVRRFRYSKRRKEFDRKEQDETKHARFGLDEEDSHRGEEEEEDEDDDMEPVFTYFDDNDESQEKAGQMGGFPEIEAKVEDEDEDEYEY